ncbi:extracellular solute-binding protein [Actinomadura miaoliensis]|uniref:Extracellular solute-binding protein n=1 Tax=Actinomadura miaoliensis TaxID=430685 RepID=A0ABP7X3B2_9ACTN
MKRRRSAHRGAGRPRLIGPAAVLAALAVAAAPAAGGCAKGGLPNAAEGKGIRFVAARYDDGTRPYWQSVIRDFEARNPGYKVRLEVVDWEQIDAKTKREVQTRQQPDVLNLNKFSDFARDGLLYRADEVLSPRTRADFLPVFRRQSRYRDAMYGIPFISSARLFFYNKDVFAKAGLSRPPATWDDVRADAEKIRRTGVIPLGLPLGPEEAEAEFFMWTMNNGGGWTGPSGRWAIDQPANVDTLTFLRGLTKAGLTQPNPETTNRKDVFNRFAQGQIGMLNGAVFLPKGFIDPVNRNLRYGVAPLPSRHGTTHNTLGVVDFLMAFRRDGGRNREAVSRFLEFVYRKDNAVRFLRTGGFLPVTRSAGRELSADPYLREFVKALPSARFAPTGAPAWQAVDGAAKQYIGTAVAAADPATVLRRLQRTAERS